MGPVKRLWWAWIERATRKAFGMSRSEQPQGTLLADFMTGGRILDSAQYDVLRDHRLRKVKVRRGVQGLGFGWNLAPRDAPLKHYACAA
eukprot:275666-Chlamydomonas_euryale.AAC.1